MAASQSSAAKRAKTTVLSDGADLQRVMVDDCTVLATAPADGSAFVCTHHGTFHCDEAMACGMLRMLPEFADMPVVRTRDPAVIDAAHIVVDVGGTYDADARRFDHHQREFTEPFRPAPEGGATKPEDEPVRMSSAGLVYRHYGRDVIAAITGGSLPAESAEQIYQKVYERLIREVDAVDNGVEPFDGPARYRIRTGLGGRVGRLNASWNEDGGAEVENTRFKQAMHVASSELVHVVTSLVDSWLPARDIVKEAMSKRIAGGRALVLDRFCPWQEHLLDLEREGAGGAAPGEVLYVMFCDRRGGWRGQAVPKALGSFENRCPFPEAWRGLRDAELSAAVGIEDGVFVHAAGFIGGAHSEAGMTTMVEKAVAAAPARAFPVTTGGEVTGYRVTQVIGVVSAANVRSRNLMADLWTALAGAFGGEAGYYTHLMNESTSAAMDRAVHRTKELGGDGLVNVRFEMATSMNRLVMGMHASVICYGTAVKLEKIE